MCGIIKCSQTLPTITCTLKKDTGNNEILKQTLNTQMSLVIFKQ